ncbi:hypothetical protein [Pseudomonas putida]|uniref:hypothetical protein n=1 Tax=Pseudomonas putida TaxID=303 RepID=UPI001577294B|nr:hypothetical protein [Pseudomonas putida]NTY90440.1 hypothetical protein [Pseudomonas putida]NTY98982.1 hypothetical protein [Pseudomonas putida]NTZ21265.1 hypothetical protein [Pseudomonas putida]NTZ53216.1 hypothetical protein [Pseudomonas putida]NTZ65134.1 hypothetical protein [Pseudomonas putida]
MLKVVVLQQLSPDLLPRGFKEIMTSERPARSLYFRINDRRLIGCYNAYLDCYGLASGQHMYEAEFFEKFLEAYTDETPRGVRSQILRLEELQRVMYGSRPIGGTPVLIKFSWPEPKQERLKFYRGWFVPGVGVTGKYVNLSNFYYKYGDDFCCRMHAALIDFATEIHCGTAAGKMDSVIQLGGILTEVLHSPEHLKRKLPDHLDSVLTMIWAESIRDGVARTRSRNVFADLVMVLNQFYVRYGFIDPLGSRLTAEIARSLLGAQIMQSQRFI